MLSIKIDCPITHTSFGDIFYPEFPIGILLADGSYQDVDFILDTGADCTLVPKYLALLAGTLLPDAPDDSVVGISSNTMPAYRGKLQMRIQDEEFEIRCLFTESNETPFLLGRVDFFSLFNVSFDGQGNFFTLEKTN